MRGLDQPVRVGKVLTALAFSVLALGKIASAATVHLCEEQAMDKRSNPAQRCSDVAPPLKTAPLWSLQVAGKPASMGPRIQVTGVMKGRQFLPSAIESESIGAATGLAALPLSHPLLGELSVRPFGVEERVDVAASTDAALAISCRSGTSTAGLIMTPDSGRLPRAAHAQLRVRARGDLGFQWGAAAQGADATLLRPIAPMSPADLEASIPLDIMADALGGGRASFVVLCPAHPATLTIHSIDLRPVPVAGEGLRAAWVWQAERWRKDPAALIAEAQASQLRRLYVALVAEPGQDTLADAALLADFISMASARDIEVWAVEGDPGMASPEGREHALQRLRVLQRYQATMPPAARLGGIQYDIEPYLLPAYQTDPRAVAAQWATTIQLLRQHSELKLDMVLPFWLPQSPMADIVLDALQQTADSLTIMAYRVGQSAIQQVAEPLLAWGAKEGVPVHVALEAGILDDELTQFYTEAPVGQPAQLWLLPAGSGSTAVLLPESILLNEGKGYNPHRQQPAPAALVSFQGDRRGMLKVAQQLQPVLRAWPSYAGMVFHGLLE